MYEKRNEYSGEELKSLRDFVSQRLEYFQKHADEEYNRIYDILETKTKKVWFFFKEFYSDLEIANMIYCHEFLPIGENGSRIYNRYPNLLWKKTWLEDMDNILNKDQTSVFLSDYEVRVIYGK